MTEKSDRVSAQIIQFPARGRFAATTPRDESFVVTTGALRDMAMGSGWYHDEAIKDEQKSRH